MIKIKKIIFKNNNFYSYKQFCNHEEIFNKFNINLNNFLIEKKIIFKNKFELIDIIQDLSEFDKNLFSNILGGYLNHEYFFQNITFNNNKCFGEILKLINKTYNNYENFVFNFINNFKNFNGWGWLIINNNKISMLKTFNNNNPMFSINLGGFNSIPLLCIDLHEHSYYLDYLNNKKKYIFEFLKNINWYEVENRLQNYFLNK